MIAGADRGDIAALVFPELEACRKLGGDLPSSAKAATILAHPGVRRHFIGLLQRLAALSPGSSTRVCRLLMLEQPPSMDAGEMTDKGSINQSAVLKNRTALVDELYTQPPSSRVITIEEGS